MTIDQLKRDCRFFRGDIPCQPHKQFGVHCVDDNGNDCPHYERTSLRILIVKLGALGDVIRTTPLLHKLKAETPHAEIWWLTLSPEILPKTIDRILPFNPQSISIIMATPFDIVYNLDKDREACAIASLANAKIKKGFLLKDGKCIPADAAAEHKYLTGLFDDYSKANTKCYQQEIFEMCGFPFTGEEYIMPEPPAKEWNLPHDKKIVGLNTGCGGRWTSRLWPMPNWVELARKLTAAGYLPLLLGGEQEHEKNLKIAHESGAAYLGHFPFTTFISEIDQCDLVVTAVTMGMHLTIGMKKKIVLFNNIFNKHEFELYGRGEILEPDFECSCYYSPVCPNNCMQYLKVDTVLGSVKRLLGSK
ncbi:MAG TPA: glycosyltransferase family 9 protein [Bacteroidota bacterium]|nr:glycosyltransferase family 9 protein [Bacteroidota bacterium]